MAGGMAGTTQKGLRSQYDGGAGTGGIYAIRHGTGAPDGAGLCTENTGVHGSLRTAGRPLYVCPGVGERSGRAGKTGQSVPVWGRLCLVPRNGFWTFAFQKG